MRRYRVLLATEARAQVRAIVAWWREMGRGDPVLFKQELAEVSARLSIVPGLGAPYPCDTQGVRRILLPRTRYYVYYSVDESAQRIVILTVWHTARGVMPKF